MSTVHTPNLRPNYPIEDRLAEEAAAARVRDIEAENVNLRGELEAAKTYRRIAEEESANLRELLGRCRTRLVYSTRDPFQPAIAALIDEIDGR